MLVEDVHPHFGSSRVGSHVILALLFLVFFLVIFGLTILGLFGIWMMFLRPVESKSKLWLWLK